MNAFDDLSQLLPRSSERAAGGLESLCFPRWYFGTEPAGEWPFCIGTAPTIFGAFLQALAIFRQCSGVSKSDSKKIASCKGSEYRKPIVSA
jgi:hypothetical protein